MLPTTILDGDSGNWIVAVQLQWSTRLWIPQKEWTNLTLDLST